MNLQREIEQLGFAFHRRALSQAQLDQLLGFVSHAQTGIRRRAGGMYAGRNVLWDQPGLAAALANVGLDRLAADALGRTAFPINVTYFDKNPSANWAVPGHQDRVMPVESEVPEAGFTGWCTKVGILYVEPPADVLARLVAIRVHFDPCPSRNGALAVVPGSHARGKLRDADIAAISLDDFHVCEADAGDVLLMKPLIVHRSSPAESPAGRRVLHIVYACDEPGKQIRWKRPALATCEVGETT